MSGMTPWRIGLGPVFAYEWITSSRRWQTYAVRSCFVAALLFSLLMVRVSVHAPAGTTLRELAQMAELFFLAVSGTQLSLVLLAAPAATAGAICLDRARGTIAHLLLTDLSNAEIVLGKLAARLIPILSLLACMLPVMELLALLGGVDPTALLGSFAVSLGVAVLGCSLAMLFSLWVGKTHEALMGVYAVWSLWLLFASMIDLVALKTGWTWLTPPRTADPFFLALAPYWWPQRVAVSDYWWFLGTTLSISAALVGVSVLRLRSVCLREKVGKRPGRASLDRIPNVWRFAYGRIPWVIPSLDGNPVLWREWHRSRPSRFSMVVMALFGGVSIVCSGIVIASPGGVAGAWVNGFQVSVGFLLLSVAAATTLAEERARGSLDLLLSTPLSARQIVLGKWLGAYRMVPLLAILPALVIGCGALYSDWKLWWVSLLAIAYVLSAGAAITSLGVAMATLVSRLGRAVAATVCLYVSVAAGWLMLTAFILTSPQEKGLGMASPFLWAGLVAFDITNRSRDVPIGWAIFWTAVWALVALELLRFTLGQFDRRLGRIETASARPTRLALIVRRGYFSLAAAVGVVAVDSPEAPPLIAALFTVGLLLHGRAAATSSREDRDSAGKSDPEPTGLRAARPLLAWLYRVDRVFVPVVVPALLILLLYAREAVLWRQFYVTAVYMSSIGVAFVCIADAILTSSRREGRALARLSVFWALVNGAWPVLAAAYGGESSWASRALIMGSPFLGVSSLATGKLHPGGGREDEIAWALLWSILYGASAVLLLRRARKQSRGDVVNMIERPSLPQLTPNT